MPTSNEANETFSNNDGVDAPVVVINEQVADKELKGNEEAAEEVAKSIMKVKDVPELAQYFKMLRLGVPPNAVKLKMSRENINPDLLDDPEAEAPVPFNLIEM